MSPQRFSGFPDGKTPTVRLPDVFFTELLPQVDDLIELQVTLLALRWLAQMRSNAAPWVTLDELLADPAVEATLGRDTKRHLEQGLDRAVRRGVLLEVAWERADGVEEIRYFANGPRGRAAVAAIRRGVSPTRAVQEADRPNIFTLYEENIGPLTALMSEELMEAEQTYPEAWIEEAFREAVSRNKRNWKYIHAILERWQTEGKDEIDRRYRERDRRQYIEGEFGDLIQH